MGARKHKRKISPWISAGEVRVFWCVFVISFVAVVLAVGAFLPGKWTGKIHRHLLRQGLRGPARLAESEPLFVPILVNKKDARHVPPRRGLADAGFLEQKHQFL